MQIAGRGRLTDSKVETIRLAQVEGLLVAPSDRRLRIVEASAERA